MSKSQSGFGPKSAVWLAEIDIHSVAARTAARA